MKNIYILGISCFYHDSAATLISNGEIVGAAQEERFTRKKNDSSFPVNAINYLLREAGINLSEVESVVYYEKPFVTFERILENHLNYAPLGFKLFATSIPIWIKEKLFLENLIKKKFQEIDNAIPVKIKYSEHHLSHAASAFYPSPFSEAVVVCLDGVGEWATTSVWSAKDNEIKPKFEIHYPHSIGLLYSTITAYLGFKVNSGEYKVMGLAPYGKPLFVDTMMANLIALNDDGSYTLNMDYFCYGTQLKMFDKKLEKLLGNKARDPEGELTDFHMNIAASLQVVLERTIIHLLKSLKNKVSGENLCMAGGVALNCVANSKILQETHFKKIWIQPSAGDAGGSMGAALSYWFLGLNNKRTVNPEDSLNGSYLGPSYSSECIKSFLDTNKIPYSELDESSMNEAACEMLESGKILGWFQGRMEFGPRALGHRSILGDARIIDMQKRMNLKVKFRESFRPFAPIVLEEDAAKYFDFNDKSPYMLFVASINESIRNKIPDDDKRFGIERLNQVRSRFPAITHIDYSARLQTVSSTRSPQLYSLMKKFKERNEVLVLVNTSFNVRGEPIVCSPEDAYGCFIKTDIDALVLGSFLIKKDGTPLPNFANGRENDYELD